MSLVILELISIVTLLVIAYFAFHTYKESERRSLQMAYMTALFEAYCIKQGVSVAEVKMLAMDEEE